MIDVMPTAREIRDFTTNLNAETDPRKRFVQRIFANIISAATQRRHMLDSTIAIPEDVSLDTKDLIDFVTETLTDFGYDNVSVEANKDVHFTSLHIVVTW